MKPNQKRKSSTKRMNFEEFQKLNAKDQAKPVKQLKAPTPIQSFPKPPKVNNDQQTMSECTPTQHAERVKSLEVKKAKGIVAERQSTQKMTPAKEMKLPQPQSPLLRESKISPVEEQESKKSEQDSPPKMLPNQDVNLIMAKQPPTLSQSPEQSAGQIPATATRVVPVQAQAQVQEPRAAEERVERSEIQELREMQLSIKQQLDQLQETVIDKFKQIQTGRQPFNTDRVPGPLDLNSRQIDPAQETPKLMEPGANMVNDVAFDQAFFDQPQGIHQSHQPQGEHMVKQLFSCIQGLQKQVAELSTQVQKQKSSTSGKRMSTTLTPPKHNGPGSKRNSIKQPHPLPQQQYSFKNLESAQNVFQTPQVTKPKKVKKKKDFNIQSMDALPNIRTSNQRLAPIEGADPNVYTRLQVGQVAQKPKRLFAAQSPSSQGVSRQQLPALNFKGLSTQQTPLQTSKRSKASPKLNKKIVVNSLGGEGEPASTLPDEYQPAGKIEGKRKSTLQTKVHTISQILKMKNRKINLQIDSAEKVSHRPNTQLQDHSSSNYLTLDGLQSHSTTPALTRYQTRSEKQLAVHNFLERQSKVSQKLHDRENKESTFAEKFSQFQSRDYRSNTRMNIRNQDYASQKEKRDRAMNYWQNQVIQNYLPPIDVKKKDEMVKLKKMTTSISNFKKPKGSTSVYSKRERAPDDMMENMDALSQHLTENSYIDDLSHNGPFSQKDGGQGSKKNLVRDGNLKKELTGGEIRNINGPNMLSWSDVDNAHPKQIQKADTGKADISPLVETSNP